MTTRSAALAPDPRLPARTEPRPMVHHLEIPLRGWIEPIVGAGVSVLAFSMTTEEVALGVSIATAIVLIVVWLVRVEAQGRANAKTLERLENRMDALISHLGGLPG